VPLILTCFDVLSPTLGKGDPRLSAWAFKILKSTISPYWPLKNFSTSLLSHFKNNGAGLAFCLYWRTYAEQKTSVTTLFFWVLDTPRYSVYSHQLSVDKSTTYNSADVLARLGSGLAFCL
jgi:hypothetical protein